MQFLTLRTVSSCLIFRLPMARLLLLMESLEDDEAEELRACLHEATRGGSALVCQTRCELML